MTGILSGSKTNAAFKYSNYHAISFDTSDCKNKKKRRKDQSSEEPERKRKPRSSGNYKHQVPLKR